MSSGADVANDTTVIPITTLGIDKFKERETEDFNNQSPPFINSTNPTTIATKAILKIFTNIHHPIKSWSVFLKILLNKFTKN
jgi:hypothetical protein